MVIMAMHWAQGAQGKHFNWGMNTWLLLKRMPTTMPAQCKYWTVTHDPLFLLMHSLSSLFKMLACNCPWPSFQNLAQIWMRKTLVSSGKRVCRARRSNSKRRQLCRRVPWQQWGYLGAGQPCMAGTERSTVRVGSVPPAVMGRDLMDDGMVHLQVPPNLAFKICPVEMTRKSRVFACQVIGVFAFSFTLNK